MIVLLEPAQVLLTLKAGEQIRHPKLVDALRRAGVEHVAISEPRASETAQQRDGEELVPLNS